MTSPMGAVLRRQAGNACVWQAALWDHIRRLAGLISDLWSVDLDKGEKTQTPLLWLRRLWICNFKSCLQFYIHISLPRACLILSQLAGAALSNLGSFLLLLEGSSRGKKRGRLWRGTHGWEDDSSEGRVLDWEEGAKEEQGMRTDAGAGEERKGPFLICADDSNRNHTEPRVRQTWLEFWLSSFVTLVNILNPSSLRTLFLHCLFYCLCFLLDSR